MRIQASGHAVVLILAALAAGFACASEPATQPAVDVLKAFQDMCAAKASDALQNETITIKGRDGWLFFGPGLRHMSIAQPFWGETAAKVSRATRAEYADPLPAILDFKAQMDALAMELLVVPVPDKAAIYPDKLTDLVRPDQDGKLPRLDVQDAAFYTVLRQKGAAVLDLTPLFLAQRQADQSDASASSSLPLYCLTDTHWSPAACLLTAKLLAKELAGRAWMKDAPRSKFIVTEQTIEIDGDLARTLPADEYLPREKLHLKVVHPAGQPDSRPVESDPASPVLLLGDSHCLVFSAGGDMHSTGAGLGELLAAELGLYVDTLAVRGSGATPSRQSLLRRAQADGQYLKRKKVVIWCFSAREFTESPGWRKWPIAPGAGTQP